MKINGRKIGPGHPPYIVAEISCNHRGSLAEAVMLMGLARGAGADAVKFQAYTADTITLNDQTNPEFIIKGGPWHGRHFHDLYSATQTPFEWFPELFAVAEDCGTTIFASVFDKSSVDMLEKLDCPAYKIASMEIVDIPLIKYAAQTGKPVILSTGMASEEEIADTIEATVPQNMALLHCISGYPAPISETNLGWIGEAVYMLPDDFPVGISDHTLGWEVPVAATALGASIIEKHITVSREIDTEDKEFSLEPEEFTQMCKAVKSIYQAMQPSEAKSEETSRQARRSLYAVKDIKEGEVFTEDNVRSIRPGYGLPPAMLPKILGAAAVVDIMRGTALAKEMVNGL